MSYVASTDFLALTRRTSGGARVSEMPGIDYVLAALSRIGLVRLWAAQTPPTTNQASTVWLKPALPSWSAEGQVFLWDAFTSQFVAATPDLWFALFEQGAAPYVFQSVTVSSGTVDTDTTLLAILRTSPTETVLTLPSVGSRAGKPLQIVDWSAVYTSHVITINPYEVGGSIMRQSAWRLYSTPDQLSGVTLYPSTDLNGWAIAP